MLHDIAEPLCARHRAMVCEALDVVGISYRDNATPEEQECRRCAWDRQYGEEGMPPALIRRALTFHAVDDIARTLGVD